MADQARSEEKWSDTAQHAGSEEVRDLAASRTKMAEDRTLLANERTFASWARTGLASAGIGLGFHALFTTMQPWWLPRAIATGFLLVAILVILSAERRACSVLLRLHAHRITPVGIGRLRAISWTISLAVGALIMAIWLSPYRN